MSTDNPLFRKAAVPATPPKNIYDQFGWTQNPFPHKPGVIAESDDPRLNGDTYREDIRESEQRGFDGLLIHKDKPCSVSYLMDFATRRGRGIGKSAFLAHQRRRINRDFGNAVTDGKRVIVAAYITPPGEGRCRKYWQFSRLIAESIAEESILSQALWRLRAFSGVVPNEVLSEVGDRPEETIGNDKWLSDRGVNTYELNAAIAKRLRGQGVRERISNLLATYAVSPSEKWTDSDWRQHGSSLVFDDYVFVLQSAGFSQCILLVDDLEKIILHQNLRERSSWAEDIRHYFVDGPHANARCGFFSLFLTIHPYVQELLVPHWTRAGLDRFCSIGGKMAQEYTVYFHPLQETAAEPLVLEYLDKSRLDKAETGQLRPFDQPSLAEGMKLARGLPGELLQLFHNVVETAIREDWNQIGVDQIRQVFERQPPVEIDETEDNGALKPPVVDLLGEDDDK